MKIDIATHKFAIAAVDKVFLDGVEQKGCIMADDEKNLVRRYVYDSKGLPVWGVGEETMQTETVSGKVVITFKKNWVWNPWSNDIVYIMPEYHET